MQFSLGVALGCLVTWAWHRESQSEIKRKYDRWVREKRWRSVAP
jgi:hypothetical protein